MNIESLQIELSDLVKNRQIKEDRLEFEQNKLKFEQIKLRGLLFRAMELDRREAKLNDEIRSTPWWRKLFWSPEKRRLFATALEPRETIIENYNRLDKAGFFEDPKNFQRFR